MLGVTFYEHETLEKNLGGNGAVSTSTHHVQVIAE